MNDVTEGCPSVRVMLFCFCICLSTNHNFSNFHLIACSLVTLVLSFLHVSKLNLNYGWNDFLIRLTLIRKLNTPFRHVALACQCTAILIKLYFIYIRMMLIAHNDLIFKGTIEIRICNDETCKLVSFICVSFAKSGKHENEAIRKK
jgi:hypothetical protein